MMGNGALDPLKGSPDLRNNADQAEISLEILGKILWILPPGARARRGGPGMIVGLKIFRNL